MFPGLNFWCLLSLRCIDNEKNLDILYDFACLKILEKYNFEYLFYIFGFLYTKAKGANINVVLMFMMTEFIMFLSLLSLQI